jgi:hypothetical protein
VKLLQLTSFSPIGADDTPSIEDPLGDPAPLRIQDEIVIGERLEPLGVRTLTPAALLLVDLVDEMEELLLFGQGLETALGWIDDDGFHIPLEVPRCNQRVQLVFMTLRPYGRIGRRSWR